MVKAAIYARYSSDNQSEASIEDQIEVCRRYADQRGWMIIDTYDDRAISGASTATSTQKRTMPAPIMPTGLSRKRATRRTARLKALSRAGADGRRWFIAGVPQPNRILGLRKAYPTSAMVWVATATNTATMAQASIRKMS